MLYIADTTLTQGNTYTLKKIAEVTAISNLLDQLNISEKGKILELYHLASMVLIL